MTFGVGWVGFSALEEMHYQAHLTQVYAEWQADLTDAAAALVAERVDRAAGQRAASDDKSVREIYARLATGQPRPSSLINSAYYRSALGEYGPLLADAQRAYAVYQAQPSPTNLAAAYQALTTLREDIDDDQLELIGSDDVAHHQRLIFVMLMVGLACAAGITITNRTVSAIDLPIRRLGSHLARVARGEFANRVAGGGPVELERLGAAVNAMTADLDRLYAAERDRVTTAEAIATHERELTAAKEFWTNTVVHDLKGPLSIIAGYADLLESERLGRLGPAQQEAVAELRRAASELLGLADDINDSFRPRGRLLAAPSPARRAGRAALGHRARVLWPGRRAPQLRYPAELPEAPLDGRLVQRVLRNIVGNAYKHAGADANVTLRAQADRGYIFFAVEDNGPGIPPEERQRIFERFVQGSGSAAGSGLGLAFCKLVIEQHGGRIWAEAVPSGGTRICFALPLAASDAPPHSAAA